MMAEVQTRTDLFEPGDLTALVCIEDAELQHIVLQQLNGMNYKIHTGLYGEDVSLKLRAHSYDVVVVNDTFGGADIEYNQVLNEARNLPMSQRRQQVFVLIGPNMVTGDEMQAFAHSVDLVMGFSDCENFRMVLRRAAARHKEFNARFMEILDKTGHQ